MKKLLVPTDFSMPAEEAFKFAMALASKKGFEVIVLKVNDLPFSYERTLGVNPGWHDPALVYELADQAKKDFEIMKGLVSDSPVEPKLIVERGHVTATLLRVIEEQDINLVIMGKTGAGVLEELLIGSNTVKMIRSSPVPVIAVKTAPDVESIKHILFPNNLNLDQDQVIVRIKELQRIFNATLHIVMVNTPYWFMSDKDMREKIEKFKKRYNFDNFTLEAINDLTESEGILNYITEKNIGLVAMGTHGRKGFSHMVMGSITEDVVEYADCPIWAFAAKKNIKE